MVGGWISIAIGIIFAFLGIGGKGRASGGGLVVSAGAGIILVIAGAWLLSI
jgi:hypothetical protein